MKKESEVVRRFLFSDGTTKEFESMEAFEDFKQQSIKRIIEENPDIKARIEYEKELRRSDNLLIESQTKQIDDDEEINRGFSFQTKAIILFIVWCAFRAITYINA